MVFAVEPQQMLPSPCVELACEALASKVENAEVSQLIRNGSAALRLSFAGLFA